MAKNRCMRPWHLHSGAMAARIVCSALAVAITACRTRAVGITADRLATLIACLSRLMSPDCTSLTSIPYLISPYASRLQISTALQPSRYGTLSSLLSRPISNRYSILPALTGGRPSTPPVASPRRGLGLAIGIAAVTISNDAIITLLVGLDGLLAHSSNR
jgi:hypothetical protein